MSRRPERNRRGGVGSPWAAVMPTDIQGASLRGWFRARPGALAADVTIVAASVSNDTLATWSLSNLGVRVDNGDGTVLLTDTATGTTHNINRAPTNLQAGPCILDWVLKPGTLSWVQLFLSTGVTIFINLATATAGTAAGGVTATLLSGAAGGLQTWRTYGTYVSGNVAVLLSPDGVNTTYAGGTGTVSIGTGATYGPVLTQQNVSDWKDQGALGNHATQVTATARPIYRELDAAGLWVPSGGCCAEIGNAADVEKSLNLPAAFYDAFDGDSAPMTVIAVVRRTGTLAADSFGVVRLTGVTARRDIGQVDSATNGYQEVHTDDAAATKTWLSTRSASTSKHTLISRNATTEDLYANGAIDPLCPRDVDVGVQSFTAGIIGARSRAIHEMAIWSASLTDQEAWLAAAAMAARNPGTPLPAKWF